jgi:D-glycero-D-manno-heptose 1,7-bisphosphate phosphatase
MRPAVFLDRDGVLVRDCHLLTQAAALQLEPGAAEAIVTAQRAGYAMVVVTNQTVISRGLCTEDDVAGIHSHMLELLRARGCAPLDAIYVCPHHPHASVSTLRRECECRKPKPGMLLRAAAEHALDLSASVMIGDRISDVIAGRRAGCRTILVRSGAQIEPAIVGVDPEDTTLPDVTCASLREAIELLVGGSLL